MGQYLSFCLLTVFSFLLLVTTPTSVSAQCVRCKPAGQCFACSASVEGGCTCIPTGCSDCITSTPCGAGRQCPDGLCSTSEALRIDDSTIINIAEEHPRFAVALAMANRIGNLQEGVQITSFPGKLDKQDIGHWLALSNAGLPDATKDFFERRKHLATRKQELFIRFETRELGTGRYLVNANIENPYFEDPPSTNLEIIIDTGKVVHWRIY